MTAVNCRVNNATGSDTAASGYGPSTAVSGANAATVATTNAVVVAGSDLSTISVGDALWVDASSGREFDHIATVDDGTDTMTTDGVWANTEGSRTWACGGKRKTLDNASTRLLFLTGNLYAGDTVTIEDSQSLTSALTITTNGTAALGMFRVTGLRSGAKPTITQTANATALLPSTNSGAVTLEWMKVQNSNGSKTLALGVSTSNTESVTMVDMEIGDSTNTLLIGINNTTNAGNFYLYNCWIHHTTGDGVNLISTGSATLYACVINNCGGIGLDRTTTIGATTRVRGCLIYANTSDGIVLNINSTFEIVNNTIHGNGGDGIDVTSTSGTGFAGGVIVNNNITGNGGYGINGATVADKFMVMCNYNNYGTGALANTSGALNNVTAGANDVALNPAYNNAATGDFTVGVAVKGLGWPATFLQGVTTSSIDLGASQRAEAAASGGISGPGASPIGIHTLRRRR